MYSIPRAQKFPIHMLVLCCLDLCTPKLLILSPEPSPKESFIFGEARIVSKDCPWIQL